MEYQTNDYELIYMIREHNLEEELLYQKYEPMIKSEIKKYIKQAKYAGLDIMDLYQEGMVGLSDALKYYDELQGTQFSTYAYKCIRGKVMNCIRKETRQKRGAFVERYSLSKEMSSGLKIEDLLANDADVEKELYYKHLANEITRFKHSLPIMHSLVFELRMNGFSSREVSMLLELSYRTVNNYWHRSNEALKRSLSI